MAGNILQEFLVSIGYRVDTTSQQKAVDGVKKHEAAVTAAVDTEGAKRLTREQFRERLKAAGNDLSKVKFVDTEKKTASVVEKLEKETAKKTVDRTKETATKLEQVTKEGSKKNRSIRNEEMKEIEQFALRITSISGGIVRAASGIFGGVGVGAFITSIGATANAYSNLYVQANRVGSSPRSIQALQYALQQMGVSKEETSGSLEGFAEKLRTNPEGYRHAIAGMGARTTDARGQGLEAGPQLEEIGKALARMPYNLAKIRGSQLGLGENVVNALRQGSELRKHLSDFDQKLAAFGFDPDKMSEEGRKFNKAYDDLKTNLLIIKDQIVNEFFEPLTKAMERFSKWLQDNPKDAKLFAEGLTAAAALLTLNVIPVFLRLLGLGRALSVLSLPVWALKALGLGGLATTGAIAGGALLGSTTAANAGEPTIGPDGRITYPDGHSVQGRHWDGRSGKGARLGDRSSHNIPDDSGVMATGAHTPMKDLISKLETGTSGPGGYETVYGHAERGGALAPPKPITQMTIGEILAYQRQMRPRSGAAAFPVGRGQWVESTLRKLTRGMDPNTVFSPEVQERLLDRSIAGRMGQGPGGFRSEWDSFKRLSNAEIAAAAEGHRAAIAAAAASPSLIGRASAAGAALRQRRSRNLYPSMAHAVGEGGALQEAGQNFFSTHPLGHMQAGPLKMAPDSFITSSTRGDTSTSFNQNVTVNGVNDPHAIAAHVRATASRGSQDLLRHMEGATQ